MKISRQRTISRSIHNVVGIVVAVYVYLPAGALSDATRVALMWGGVPIVSLSGTCLWKGVTVQRLIRNRRAVAT